MKAELVNYTINPIETIEKVASNCYDSDNSNSNGKIMKHCFSQGHLSIGEFAQFHFHIEGVSRACSHQLIRHRTGKFCQRSQRFCQEGEFDYVTPNSILNDEDIFKLYEETISKIKWFYKVAIHNGIPAEDARFILPNSCETVIDVSFDLRNLMHFFNERLCSNAQWEIRELAVKMKNEVLKVCPELKEYLVAKCEINSKLPMCNEGKRCCGKHKTIQQILYYYENTMQDKDVNKDK